MAAAFEAAGEELAALLVTSVGVERAGAHDHVTVWLRGMNVGTLTAGPGEGLVLRRLLESETIVSRARELVRLWRSDDGFGATVVDELGSAIDLVDRQTLPRQERSAG